MSTTNSDEIAPTGQSVLGDEELLQKAQTAANGHAFQLRFQRSHDDPALARQYDTGEDAARALMVNLAWWTRHDHDQMVRLFSKSKIAETLTLDTEDVHVLADAAIEFLDENHYDPTYHTE